MVELKRFSLNADWRAAVPEPIYDARPEWVQFYYTAWELAWDHVRDIPGLPNTPYMDEGFCDCEMWIWDTCFMSLFCKYAPDVFPGVESLENFYELLFGDKPFPKIVTKNAPWWTGWKIGETVPLRLHIADNPPLFAWAEYQNALFTGDRERLRRLLVEKQYLQKFYNWLESLSAKGEFSRPEVSNPSCWYRDASGIGYHWEGGRSGMDNTPRGRVSIPSPERPNNPDMLWVDAIGQMGLAARCIAELAELIGESDLAAKWRAEFEAKRQLVNQRYWDEKKGCYFDIDSRTGAFFHVLTTASAWPALSGMADRAQMRCLCRHLTDPDELGGEPPLLSLARNDAEFSPLGRYWRGALWLPTAYMAVKGMDRYDEYALASDCAEKILDHMYRTYMEFSPHTIWECYSPTAPQPATVVDDSGPVRRDFCGWSALGPISLFLEDVIGIRSVNAFQREVEWVLPTRSTGRVGVKKLRFADVTVSLVYENGSCRVESDAPFSLRINGRDFPVVKGVQKFAVELL